MANTFLELSTTAASNTEVDGISIQGTAPVSNFDGALRSSLAILRAGLDGKMVLSSKSANYTAVADDNNALIRFSAAATLSLTAAATLGANWHCWVMADGGDVVIDPNSSETINGASTITIPDGYSTLVVCDGTNFRALEDYATISAAITALDTDKADAVQATVDVASATTTDIGAVASQNVRVTGTTTITGLGTVAAGTYRGVRFGGILTLTHNGTSLILPGAANITTADGDVAEFISEGSGNWRCVGYRPAIKPYGVIQEVSSFTGAVATGTTTIPDDDTIPQNTEGTEFLSVSITPTRSDSILEIEVQFISSANAATARTVALFQSGTASALAAARPTTAGSGIIDGANIRHRMTSGTTSSTTFSVRAGPASGATVTFNGAAGSRRLGGVMNSYIIVRELLP